MEAHFREDIDLLLGVRRRATKLISAIEDEIYEDRLHYVNLTTLETRRLRGDLIEELQILCMFFYLSQAHTRGHSLKLIKPRCHLDIRKFSFAHRVIDISATCCMVQ